MKTGNYATPAQLSIFLGNIWIDDAYRVEVRENNTLVPLYGYSDKEFTAVAQGKAIINGSLIINYRYPEYLRAAIDGIGKKKTEMDRTVALAHRLNVASVEDRVKLLEEARMKEVDKELGNVLREKYSVPTPAKYRADDENLASTMSIDPNEELDLRIWYDTPERAKYYTIIQGVRLIGRAMTISNAASGGDASSSGQNLFEIYSFFAKRIVNRRTHGYATPSTEGYGKTSEQEILASLNPTYKREGSES